MNGLVERAIRTIQDTLEESGLKKTHLHATGLQTFCKLVENQFNNLPLGFKKSRDADNSELLKILTPNMLRHGRINSRALEGPVRLPGSLTEMEQRVTDIYQSWFKIWSTVAVPKLAHRTKWFIPERSLDVGDIVYFQKDSSGMECQWTTGMVDEAVAGNDGLVREVVIRYRNSSKEFDRFTDRAARSCVRLHNMDDNNLADDLHELTERLSRVKDGEHLMALLDVQMVDSRHQVEYNSAQTELQPSPACNDNNLFSSVASSSFPEDLLPIQDNPTVTDSVSLSTSSDPAPATIPTFCLTPADTVAGKDSNGDKGQHPLLIARSRSPLGNSREDEESLSRALMSLSIQTPVIVCDESSQHTPQAQSCLTATPRRPTAHPAPPSIQITRQCKKCCCVSHHMLTEHKLKRGAVPLLACDVSDLRLTFSEAAAGLKAPEQFASLNEMIWSCELHFGN